MSNVPRVSERVGLGDAGASLRAAVQTAGFWAAVAIPFVVVAAIAGGLWQRYPLTFAALLALNLAALVAGQGYNR